MRWRPRAAVEEVLWPVAEPVCSMSFRKLHLLDENIGDANRRPIVVKGWKSPCARS